MAIAGERPSIEAKACLILYLYTNLDGEKQWPQSRVSQGVADRIHLQCVASIVSPGVENSLHNL